MKKFLTFLTLLTLFFTVGWAETVTINFNSTFNPSLPTASGSVNTTATAHTVEGLSIKEAGIYKGSSASYIMFAQNKGYLYNTENLGTINSVSVTYSSGCSTSAKVGVYFGNTEQSTYTITNNQTISGVSKTDTWTNTTSGYGYFQLSTNYKNTQITKIVIDYTPGGTTPTNQVSTPVITLNPESGIYAGDNVTATISCETEGATIYYTTDNTAPTTTSATIENGGTLTITSDCTIKAFAVKADMDDSEIAEKEVSFTSISTANTVAQILALEGGTKFKFTGNLVVSGKSGNQLYAQDETGGIHFYGSTPNYTFGDVIPAGFIATFVADYNGAPELTTMERMAEATTHGEQLDAATLTPSQITANNENAFIYAVIKNATISGTTITANGETVTVQTTFSNDLPTDGKSYDFYGITNWNSGGKFMLLSYEDHYEDPGEGWYLVGTFNNWRRYEGYKFTEANGTYTLNNIDIPNNAQFKIQKYDGTTESWYGGKTDNETYGIHGGWHTDITANGSKNFNIENGGVSHFTFVLVNDNNNQVPKFTVNRDAQLYFKCEQINNWENVAMTANDNGWTITCQLPAGAKFGFNDEWNIHHGYNWTVNPEHYGDNYDIPVATSDTYTMRDAGYYKIDVNGTLTVMHVNKEFAINCSANPNAGGTVTAKVGGETVESAMAGETVTIEYTTANGYTFNNITLNDNVLDPVEGVYSFVMPNQDATVVANYTAQSYAITVVSENGTTTCPATATTGSTVTFAVTPNTDYTVLSVTASFVNGENTTNVPVTYNEETGEYSFGMPPFPVTVTVTYKAPPAPITIPFVETWDGTVYNEENTGRTGGNDDNWSGSIASGTIVADKEGWEYSSGSGASQCIKLGTGKNGGSATTPNIIVTNGTTYKMTFRAGAWDGSKEATTLSLEAEGASLFEDASCETALTEVTTVKGAWTTYTVYVKATAANMNITWYTSAGNNRFFLDDVNIDYITESKTLAEIVALGAEADGKVYTISDENGLLGVYKSGNTVWFKDKVEKTIELQNETLTVIGGAVDFDKPGDEQNYWINNVRTKDFDQSNWIEVVFPADAEGIAYENVYVKNLTGVYSYNGGNRKLTITNVDALEENGRDDTYTPNTYIPANFAGTQNGYFFSKPKVQEYAYFVKAQWNGSQMVMATDDTNNPERFTGAFSIMPVDGLDATHHVNDFYQFHGIVRKGTVGSPRLQADGDDIVVEATDLDPDNVVTAISTIETSNGEVKSVKYVNVAGVVSDRPFQGVNIVVTEYTDGSRTTAKVVK